MNTTINVFATVWTWFPRPVLYNSQVYRKLRFSWAIFVILQRKEISVLFGLLSISFHYVQLGMFCCHAIHIQVCTMHYALLHIIRQHLTLFSIEVVPLSIFQLWKVVFLANYTLHIAHWQCACVDIIELNDKFHSLVIRLHVFFRSSKAYFPSFWVNFIATKIYLHDKKKHWRTVIDGEDFSCHFITFFPQDFIKVHVLSSLVYAIIPSWLYQLE